MEVVMSNDLKNFLIGVAVAFLFLFFLGFLIFSGLFVHHLGKVSTENQIASVQKTVEKVVVTTNSMEKKLNEFAGEIKTLAKKEPQVKVVHVQSPAPKPAPKNEENTSSPLTLNDVRNVFNEGMGDLKKEMSELRSDMDDLKAGQKELGKEVENMNTRLQKIENVNQLSSNSEQALFMMFGKEKYNKLLEEREKQKTAEKNISKYK